MKASTGAIAYGVILLILTAFWWVLVQTIIEGLFFFVAGSGMFIVGIIYKIRERKIIKKEN